MIRKMWQQKREWIEIVRTRKSEKGERRREYF